MPSGTGVSALWENPHSQAWNIGIRPLDNLSFSRYTIMEELYKFKLLSKSFNCLAKFSEKYSVQRPVLDSVEVRKMSYIGLHRGEGRSKVGERKWRGTEINGDQRETCDISLDQTEPRELEVPN